MKSIVILNNSAAEGSKNKRNHREDDGAGPSGESHFNESVEDLWLIWKNLVKGNSLPVSHHLSPCYYNLLVLLLSFIFGEGNPMKVWFLIDNKFNLL